MGLPPLVDPGRPLTPDEVARYSRHLIIPAVGMSGQRRLRNAKVLVIGAGGLGSPTLLYLAAAGVGTVSVIDDDTVDSSNLQRQVIHGRADVGRPKVESAADRVAQVNPDTTVVTHRTRLDTDNALDLFAAHDVVIDGTDNFATRYLVNDAAVLTGTPYVYGSIFRFDGQVSVFWAEHGPCYRCLHPEPPPPGAVPSCAEGGVLGVLCGAIGSAQAAEAIKLITGIGEPLVGRLQVHDSLAARWDQIPLGKDPDCALCGDHPTQTTLLDDYDAFCGVAGPDASRAAVGHTISVEDLQHRLANGSDREVLLVDVREPAEAEINAIPGSTLVPRGDFLSGAALADLPQDRTLILYCKTGVRSAECLAVLHEAGFTDALHVGGGVAAWVDRIDPTQVRY